MDWNHRSNFCNLESCNESFRTLLQLCLCEIWEFCNCVFQVQWLETFKVRLPVFLNDCLLFVFIF